MKEGEIDCALVHMPIDDPQLNIQTLATLEDCFVVGRAFQQLANRSLTAKELAELPLFYYPQKAVPDCLLIIGLLVRVCPLNQI